MKLRNGPKARLRDASLIASSPAVLTVVENGKIKVPFQLVFDTDEEQIDAALLILGQVSAGNLNKHPKLLKFIRMIQV